MDCQREFSVVLVNQAINLEKVSSENALGRLLMNSALTSVKNPVVHAGKLDPLHLQALVHASLLGQSQTSIVVHQWLASGVDIEDVYLEGITPVARLLGQWWCDDVIDFASATLAFSHLRQLLYELSPLFLMDASEQARGLTCFMVGEFQVQHTMGVFMLSEFFRRNGWQVRCDECESGEDLIRKMSSDWFDLMAISLSCERQVPLMRKLIPMIRKASPNPDLKIIAGGALLDVCPEIVTGLGVELMTQDARSAQKSALDLVSDTKNRSNADLTIAHVN
jgi:MerR family transcriptional regulator, light-induced transcriptional regulator